MTTASIPLTIGSSHGDEEKRPRMPSTNVLASNSAKSKPTHLIFRQWDSKLPLVLTNRGVTAILGEATFVHPQAAQNCAPARNSRPQFRQGSSANGWIASGISRTQR
jgi:hypothetical protein